jgi:hypothetical protein
MEGIWRNVGTAPLILVVVTCQLHIPVALLSEKNPPILEAGWAANSVWRLWKGENGMSISEVLNKAMPILFVTKRYTEGR